MSHAELLARLLPPVSYAVRQSGRDGTPVMSDLQAELAAEGAALDAAQASARRIVRGVTPLYAEALLPDWERVCGLTPAAGATYQQRLELVLAKLAEVGGLSLPYFTRLAANLGYRIDIDEPQPFRAGVNRAGDRLWTPDIQWVWLVVVHGGATRTYRFRAGGSVAGERLTTFGDPVIEALFEDLKPAHTFVYFAYQET